MKHKYLLSLLLCLLTWPFAASAQTAFVNLTPKPASMTVGEGTLVLPQDFVVSYAADADAAMVEEVNRFVTAYNRVTGSRVKVAAGNATALFQVGKFAETAERKAGAYALQVAADRVTIQADDALALFYAFQSVKKMLPANVMAGVADAKVTTYSLPLVTINDEPRFEYRGFMLDVSRHFFTVEDIKRLLDVMAYYKMNRFHWHLSDDQGWRIEIKKYPKLTEVGSIAPNCLMTDMYSRTRYWLNKPYGPYFYTQDQVRDVVAYAQKLHIDIVPEIDMPGHFTAAMAAYPEYSCTPQGTHNVWIAGGISGDVLNVANAGAVQFAKDILAELIDLFPYERIHIGGDECPTTAWEYNAECQARYAVLNLTNYRQLQSLFIKEMADFVQSKGRKLSVWNESITAGSADTETVKSTGALVYCWTGPVQAVNKAEELGLSRIYTPQFPYYINKYQGDPSLDPPAAGYGNEDVKHVYEHEIPANVDAGIQATFWTEAVNGRDYLEWLTLPRLTAIAEAGWTPQANRSFTDFQQRITADTVLLNYNNYKWCDYQMVGWEKTIVLPGVSTATEKHYYRLISGVTSSGDARVGRCIELVADGSPLLTSFSGNNIAVGRLWTNTQAEEGADNYDYQWWYIEADPAGSGNYALVCKAQPNGSVNPTSVGSGTSARWNYDATTKHYSFVLGAGATGKVGDNYFYTISTSAALGDYFNSSLGGQGYAVNIYGLDASAKWQFAPMPVAEPQAPAIIYPKANTAENKYYYRIISKAADGRKGSCIELLSATSPKIGTGNAQENRLWSNAQAAEGADNYDYQWWSLEEDPENAGRFALVCKAKPNGSVNTTPTGLANTGRWDYDVAAKHYDFILGHGGHGSVNGNYYYTIHSTQSVGTGANPWYMNAAAGGQNYSINVYQGTYNSSDAVFWEFVPAANYYTLNFTPLTYGETYMFSNAVEGFQGTALTADGGNTSLLHSADPFAANAWAVTASEVDEAHGVQTLNLRNVTTGQYISGASATYQNRVGYPVSVAAGTQANVALSFDEACGEYRLQINGRSLFPLPEAGTVSSGSTLQGAAYDAPRLQGATWHVTRVKPVVFQCEDLQGTSLGQFTRYVDADLADVPVAMAPEIASYAIQSMTKTAEGQYAAVYANVSNMQIADGVEQFEVVRPFTAEQLTYNRHFSNTNWQAWYMPFEMNYEDWADQFDIARLNDVHQYDDDEDGQVDRTELEVVYVKSGSIEANTPYLIRAKETGDKALTLTNATVVPTVQKQYDVTSWNTRFVFTGTYMQVLGTTMYSEGYYALAGGALQQAQDYGVSLGAFRWYLQVLDRASLSAAAPRMIRVKVVGEDDNATGIYPLQPVEAMPAVKVYDINGRLVRQGTRSLDSLPKGVYVINGKKYIK